MHGDDDFERRAAWFVAPAVIEERVKGLDARVEKMEHRVEQLATKDDVADLKKTIEKKNDRSFDWLKTVVGGAAAGIIVGLVMVVVSAASGHPVVH